MSAAPRPWRLEQRLRRRLLGGLGGAWLLAAAVAGGGAAHELHQLRDEALEDQARRLLSLPLAWDRAAPPRVEDEQEGEIALQLFDPAGRMLWRSEEAPATALAALDREGSRIEGRWRVHVAREAGRAAVAAEPLKERLEAIGPALAWLLAPLLALLPLLAWGLHRELRQGFASLAPARAALARRDGRDLSPLGQDPALRAADGSSRLPGELAPLVEAIDALLARLGRLLAAERQFAAASAHELRTPLAAAQAQLQRLQAELDPALPADHPARARLAPLTRQLQRLGELSAKLLQLARVDAGVGLAREPVALDELVRLVLDEFVQAGVLPPPPVGGGPDPGAEVPGWSLDLQPLSVRGDLDALGIALRNLVENSLRHGGPPRRISLRAEGAEAVLNVEDAGPGVPPERLADLVQAFQRLNHQAEGSGLGLAIVDAVARQSGGRLLLTSPLAPGRPGLRATLRLPRGADAGAD